MSKVVRNIWGMKKVIWDHRNSYVHASNGTIHQYKEEDMTMVIRWGFAVGQNGLPATYSELFTGQVQRLLKDDGITKYQCLCSIWNITIGIQDRKSVVFQW